VSGLAAFGAALTAGIWAFNNYEKVWSGLTDGIDNLAKKLKSLNFVGKTKDWFQSWWQPQKNRPGQDFPTTRDTTLNPIKAIENPIPPVKNLINFKELNPVVPAPDPINLKDIKPSPLKVSINTPPPQTTNEKKINQQKSHVTINVTSHQADPKAIGETVLRELKRRETKLFAERD
jgi:hypothetical protein